MSTSIFIKTWKNDLEWLRYCVRSIRKFVTGIDDVFIVLDESCRDTLLESESLFCESRLYYVPEWEPGYIHQQVVKLHAYRYTESEFILYVDSDCVFHTPCSPESYMKDGKPILLKTKYGEGKLGDAESWKAITESFVGGTVEYDYMRRLPWLYRRDTLIAFRNTYPELDARLRAMKNNKFSEFNALGCFIDRWEQEKYFISDTEDWTPESVAKQYWSWGNITDEIREEMEVFLK